LNKVLGVVFLLEDLDSLSQTRGSWLLARVGLGGDGLNVGPGGQHNTDERARSRFRSMELGRSAFRALTSCISHSHIRAHGLVIYRQDGEVQLQQSPKLPPDRYIFT
jgi:hypothetical protein